MAHAPDRERRRGALLCNHHQLQQVKLVQRVLGDTRGRGACSFGEVFEDEAEFSPPKGGDSLGKARRNEAEVLDEKTLEMAGLASVKLQTAAHVRENSILV